MRRIAILGSTGSIGTQSLDVIRRHPESFCATALAARSSAAALAAQVREFSPAAAALVCPPEGFAGENNCEWSFGEEALLDICAREDVDAVLVAVVGIAGLPAVLRAIECGKTVLLANKEALVTGGALVMEAARRKGVSLLPVDSEHSAIFQCIQGRPNAHPRRIVLTASGGPLPHLEPRADRAGHGRAGAAPSELVHGPQDHHRQRLHGQQGPGGHRGALAL